MTSLFVALCWSNPADCRGDETADQITELARQVEQYQQAGDLTKAIASTEQLVALLKESTPQAAADIGEVLVGLGQLHMQNGDEQNADLSLKQAEQVLTTGLGTDHWRTIDVRLIRGELQLWQKLSDEQREQLNQSDALREQQMIAYQAGELRRSVDVTRQLIQIEKQVLGPQHQQVAESLDALGILCSSLGDYQDAAAACEEALNIRKKVFGEQHPKFADSLNNQAGMHHDAGDYAAAARLFRKALEILKTTRGVADPSCIGALDNLAGAHAAMTEYDEAETLYLQAHEAAEQYLDRQDPLYGRILNNLAAHYGDVGDYSRARELTEQSLQLTEQLAGQQSPEYAVVLNNIAKLDQQTGSYEAALRHYRKSCEISRRLYGDSHPDVAITLANIAQVLRLQGDLTAAEQQYLTVIAMQEQLLGKNHPDYVTSLDGLAGLYELKGDYVRADRLFREALEIRKRTLGEDHQDYGQSLNNLAGNLASMGDYAGAEFLYVQSIDLVRRVLGEDHVDYATALSNLASWYWSVQEFEKAQPLLVQAQKIYHDTHGDRHPSWARCTKSLGRLLLDLEQPQRAKSLIEQALNVETELFGEQSAERSETLGYLSIAAFRTGDPDEAERLARDALRISNDVLGDAHPQTLELTGALATACFLRGNYDEAHSLFHTALQGHRELVETTSHVQSERQQLSMAEGLRFQLDVFLSMAVQSDLPKDAAFREVLAWKGATLVRQRRMRQAAADQRVAPLFRRLQRVSSQLATAARVVPNAEDTAAWKQKIAELSAKKERLEAQLSEKSAIFREIDEQITLEDLQQALPEETVLVDFLEYGRVDPQQPAQPPVRSLLVCVVRRDGTIHLADLGAVAPISESIDVWRNTFGMSRDGRAAGNSLRRVLWEPIAEHIDHARLILVSVDGVLGRLPLAALPGKKPASYLLEDHRIAMLPVPQLLPALVNEIGRRKLNRGLLLMGDVDYEQDDSAPSVNRSLDAPSRSSAWAVRGAGMTFSPLAETGAEIDAIRSDYLNLLQADPEDVYTLRQQQATEQEFREIASRFGTLHLATHGFFSRPLNSTGADRNTGSSDYRPAVAGTFRPAAMNPGLLSGLAFSGANRAPEAGQDDGILTADEIASLGLENAQLVVLSACETGLGEVAGGEGLLGVQRAFQVAGADATVASLWQVGDVATKLLMQRFYRNLWKEKMTPLDALREAQLHLLNHPKEVLNHDSFRGDSRVRPGQTNQKSSRLSPQFWAAFSLSGAWE